MKKVIIGALCCVLTLSAGATSQAAVVTYTDTLLGTGLSVSSDGVTMTASTTDGILSNIGGGTFAGLWVGVNDALGTYILTFSEFVTSIEIQFDAISPTGSGDPETIFGFATDTSGAVSIDYTNIQFTSFDGTTITSVGSDNGMGIIRYAGDAFNQFIFTHAQDPSQNGFVIERIVINTSGVISDVPLPAAAWLFLAGVAGLGAARKRRSVK